MLKKLFLKFGSGEASLPLEFEPGHVTILVGPNNSGKSLFLREIEAFTRLDDAAITKLLMGEGTDLKIIEWIELDLPAEDEVERSLLFRDVGVDAEWGRASPGYIHVGKLDLVYDRRLSRTGLSVRAVHPQKVVSSTVSARISEHERKRNPGMWGIVFRDFVELFTIRLDGGTRLALTEPHSAGNRRQRARNHLWSLSQDPDTRNRLREMTYDAFGRYFVLDPTEMQVFRIKMSHTPPSDGVEDQLGPEAQEFFEQSEDIADLSDGIKAFTGLTAAVTGTDYKVMLIDEPEAFLHPTLAGKLGGT